ncbi:hypothetical protein TgHK011_009120 [Trichoderma gracile]|nr:hypothetical protein TgHK011_009120 [Trichoderma gracile]
MEMLVAEDQRQALSADKSAAAWTWRPEETAARYLDRSLRQIAPASPHLTAPLDALARKGSSNGTATRQYKLRLFGNAASTCRRSIQKYPFDREKFVGIILKQYLTYALHVSTFEEYLR